MTIFKSRQVNLDPHPYVNGFGNRAAGYEGYAGPEFTYSPRPEFEPTRDHAPWAESGNANVRSASEFEGSIWAPRRERFDTPVNQVLEQVRVQAERLGDLRYVVATIQRALDRGQDSVQVRLLEWTPDEIEHARKVLTRLASCR